MNKNVVQFKRFRNEVDEGLMKPNLFMVQEIYLFYTLNGIKIYNFDGEEYFSKKRYLKF